METLIQCFTKNIRMFYYKLLIFSGTQKAYALKKLSGTDAHNKVNNFVLKIIRIINNKNNDNRNSILSQVFHII